jgi:hypothetical protein
MGGGDRLERFLNEREAETVAPMDYLDVNVVFEDLLADLEARAEAAGE